MKNQKWLERWNGSDSEKGSSVLGEDGRTVIAYLGGDETTHEGATKLVFAHNELQDFVDNLHQRLDNIIAAGAIPMPNQLRLLALDESLHSIRAELAEHISYDPA